MAGQILDAISIFNCLGNVSVFTLFMFTVVNYFFFEQMNVWSKFVLILFKLHNIWWVVSQENH